MLSTLLHLLRLLTTPDVTELQQCVLDNQQFLSLHVLRYRDKIPGTLLTRYAAYQARFLCVQISTCSFGAC